MALLWPVYPSKYFNDMSVAKLDLSQRISLKMCIDKNVVYAPTISGIETLDTDYTLTLNKGEADEIIYSVGSGLTLTDTVELKSISWALDASELPMGISRGELRSLSNVAGIYLSIKIEITVQ